MFLTTGLKEHFELTNNVHGLDIFKKIEALEVYANREDIFRTDRLAAIYKIYDLRVAAAALEGTAVISGPVR